MKIDLKGLSKAKLAELLLPLGLKPFRISQIMRWIYASDVSDFSSMTNLSLDLREQLAANCRITKLSVVRERVAEDGTAKLLLELDDGERIETVGIPAGERLTVCFSTQVGCGMGCVFCATGEEGLARNLTAGEMVDQVQRIGAFFGKRVSNAVAMGQGEPFANYDATLDALRILNAPEGLEIGARHLTVSTCGIIKGIERFAEEPEQFGLAISLHSAIQAKREKLMPIAEKYPLPALKDACIHYTKKTGRRLTFEYALIAGENDGFDDLKALIEFCRDMLCHVNLIPLNPVAGSTFARADREYVSRFYLDLNAAGVETSIRQERGAEIEAACGQLKGMARGDQ